MAARLMSALVVATILVVGGVAVVFSHAEYDYSTPNDGDVLTTAPARVDAYFTQEMFNQPGANNLNVLDPAGTDVDNNDATVDPDDRKHMWVTLQAGLGSGTYTVEWATTSDEDGDEDAGTFSFTLQLPEPAATMEPAGPTSTPAPVVSGVANVGAGPASAGGDGTAKTFMLTALAVLGGLAFVTGARLRPRGGQ